MPKQNSKIQLVRYRGDRDALQNIEELFSLRDAIELLMSKTWEEAPMRTTLLAQTMRLSPLIAPRLYKICDDVKKSLKIKDPVEFYILPSAEINAYSLIQETPSTPHLVILSSALVEKLSDEELAFVIGHELGHLLFDHFYLQIFITQIEHNGEEASSISPLLRIKLLSWMRKAEISADRVGFIAMPSLPIVTSCFLKMASGLSAEYLHFDIEAYLQQMEEIISQAENSSALFTSHPANPIRVKAMQLFSKSKLYKAFEADKPSSLPSIKGIPTDTELEDAVDKLMALTEYHPQAEEDEAITRFLGAAGIVLASLDGTIDPSTIEVLSNLLLNYTSEPERYLRFKTPQEAEKTMKQSAKIILADSPRMKYTLFDILTMLMAADGKVTENEIRYLNNLGIKVLQISEKETHDLLQEGLRKYLTPSASFRLNPFKKKLKKRK